ncbi:hypothetical protein LBMAG42_19680 [Deltaproteobacteria bacterium]|nr:hypothetical protein LBMAG42_19680 [Deltaproteobacteria bacterium]
MNTEWECPLCRSTNLVPAPQCRVCRTRWPGIRARAAEDDEPEDELPSLLGSLPAPMGLVLLAVVLFFWWEPVTRPFSVPSEHSGWTASVHAERRDELRAARRDLEVLAAEMRATLSEQKPLPADWNDRLSDSRQRWQIYGEHDRAPHLGVAEVKLHSAVLELASIRFQLSTGTNLAELNERLDAVYSVLSEAGEELNNA